MPYNTNLAARVRTHLANLPNLNVEEKPMFGGLAFLVNDKMCVNISKDNLMCRFDPEQEHLHVERAGFEPVIMKGRKLRGYCYVRQVGYNSLSDFEYWLGVCLEYNETAKSSRK